MHLASAVYRAVRPVETILVSITKLSVCTKIPKENNPKNMEYFVANMDPHRIPSVKFPLPEWRVALFVLVSHWSRLIVSYTGNLSIGVIHWWINPTLILYIYFMAVYITKVMG